MASAIERLKAFARATMAPLSNLERRLISETGLPVVFEAPVDPVQSTVQEQHMPLALAGNIGALVAEFDRHFADKSFTGSGYRTYRIVHELVLAAITADGPECGELDACARYWDHDRTDPLAAAAYATALLADAVVDPAEVDTPSGDERHHRALRERCGEARRVLAFAGPRGRRHWIWRKADFHLTFAAWLAGAEDEAMLLPVFAAVQTLDPHEFGIYDDRTLQLLPRWTGSISGVDRFARAAADRTAAQFGDLLYARIYDTVLAHEPAEETLVESDRLLAAFGDWYRRFPGQPLVNRYAAHAHAFGDFATLERLFRGPLRELHPTHWFDRDQPLEAWRSISGRRRAGAL